MIVYFSIIVLLYYFILLYLIFNSLIVLKNEASPRGRCAEAEGEGGRHFAVESGLGVVGAGARDLGPIGCQ